MTSNSVILNWFYALNHFFEVLEMINWYILITPKPGNPWAKNHVEYLTSSNGANMIQVRYAEY